MTRITREYARMQRVLHAENPHYGAASRKVAWMVEDLLRLLRPQRVLDYGAGKCALRETLGKMVNGIEWVEYDPGVKGISKPPEPGESFDLVCCIDVLEHVEPECIDDVLDHLRELCGDNGTLFATVHTGPAGKVLPDGRNAHLIQQPEGWWLDRIAARWHTVDSRMSGPTAIFRGQYRSTPR